MPSYLHVTPEGFHSNGRVTEMHYQVCENWSQERFVCWTLTQILHYSRQIRIPGREIIYRSHPSSSSQDRQSKRGGIFRLRDNNDISYYKYTETIHSDSLAYGPCLCY